MVRAPRTSWNFVTLCEKGYYNDTKFHRLVPGFVLQGGDPTGTGAGGVSAWGKSFKDEFDSRLLHDSRGILSMANSGANTNNSQFFITLAATAHLDMKHPIFGRLVGGSNVLDAIEAIGAGLKEKPNEDILILGTHVFVNPIPEADALLIQTLTDAQNHRLGRTTAIPAKPSQQGPLTSTPSALNKQTTEPSAVGIRKGNGTTSTSIVNEAAVAAFMRSEGAIVDEGRSIEPQSKKKKLSNFENW